MEQSIATGLTNSVLNKEFTTQMKSGQVFISRVSEERFSTSMDKNFVSCYLVQTRQDLTGTSNMSEVQARFLGLEPFSGRVVRSILNVDPKLFPMKIGDVLEGLSIRIVQKLNPDPSTNTFTHEAKVYPVNHRLAGEFITDAQNRKVYESFELVEGTPEDIILEDLSSDDSSQAVDQ